MLATDSRTASGRSRNLPTLPPSSGHRRSHARRTLISLGATLVIAPLIGGWIVDHCPLRFRFPDAAAIVDRWKTAEPLPEIVLLGSSRFRAGLAPHLLEEQLDKVVQPGKPNVFDATVAGGEPVTMEFIARQLLQARNTAPRFVVVETSADLLPRDNLYFKMLLTRQFVAADLTRYGYDIVVCHDAISRLLSSRLTPFYLHRGQLLPWLANSVGQLFATRAATATALATAAPPKSDPTPPEERLRIALRRFQTHLRDYQLAGSTSAAFERTIASLRAHGSTVFLVQPPVTSSQREFVSPRLQAQFQPFIERLCGTYHCRFADYSGRLPDDQFVDNHHTSAEGCAAFTRLLVDEVIAPAWPGGAQSPAPQPQTR